MDFCYETGKSSIRPLQEEDLMMVLDWRNSDHVRKRMVDQHIITTDEHLNWYKGIQKCVPPRYMIYCYGGKPVGLISNNKFDTNNHTADAGYYLGELGLPLDAAFGIIYFMLEYAFEVLKLDKILGEVQKENRPSIQMDKRCGYTISDKPITDPKYGDYYDAFISKEDWSKYREKIKKAL